MIKNKFEQGQALVLLTLGIIGLVAMTGLAVDTGLAYMNQRDAQTAADAAALSAALAKVRGQNFTAAAQNRAANNGFDNNDGITTITVNNPPAAECDGTMSPYTGSNEYIQVLIRSSVDTYISPIIGINELDNCVEAVTRVTTGSASTGSFANGAAMFATNMTKQQAFLLNGNADLTTHDSCVFVNSNASHAMLVNGSATLNMDCNATVVGGTLVNGNPSITPGISSNQTSAQVQIDSSTYADVPTTVAPPTCSGPGSVSGSASFHNGSATVNNGTATFSPGTFNSIIINHGTVTFNPGTYCITGNFNLNGGSLSGPSGTVKLVLNNQNVNYNGGGTISFNDLEIYTVNGSWTLNGNAVFTANRLRFFSTGTANFIVNSNNAAFTSGNAYLYLHRGYIIWNGGADINLHAPPQGDPFGGLVVHLPWGNTNHITLNGGSDVYLVGTYLAPQCPMTFNGGNNFELHSQLIADSYIVNGNGTTDIYYVADENYGTVATPAVIELTK
jgi:hypothetical protein